MPYKDERSWTGEDRFITENRIVQGYFRTKKLFDVSVAYESVCLVLTRVSFGSMVYLTEINAAPPPLSEYSMEIIQYFIVERLKWIIRCEYTWNYDRYFVIVYSSPFKTIVLV